MLNNFRPLKKGGRAYLRNYGVHIFPWYITNQFNDQLPSSLGLSAAPVSRRSGFANPVKPEFLRLSICSCIICVSKYDDLLFIYLYFI